MAIIRFPVRFIFMSRKRISASSPGIEAYLAEFTSEDAAGEDGYLAEKGLIPMTEDEATKVNAAVANLTPLSM